MPEKKSMKKIPATRKRIAGPSMTVPAPAASSIVKSPRLGISDLTIDLAWVCGSTYVGNGTIGVAGKVYFRDLVGSIWSTAVPIVFRDDTAVGPTVTLVTPNYVSDVVKHFAFYEIESLSVSLESVLPSTATNMSAVFAPVRGSNSGPIWGTSATEVGLNAQALLGVSGAVRVPSWATHRVDMIGYVDGGYGSKGRRFATNSRAPDIGGVSDQNSPVQPPPTSFAIAGTALASDTALQGTNPHDVVVRARIRLIDFIGLLSNTFGVGSSAWGESKSRPSERVSTVTSCAGTTAAEPLKAPTLQRQSGYVVVREEDYGAASASTTRIQPNALPPVRYDK